MGLQVRSATLGFVWAAVLAIAAIALPDRALAADADKPTYELGLYVWGESVAGHVDTAQGDASTHVSFSDLLDHLNLAVMGRARANFDKLSVVFDGEYADLQTDTESRTLRLGPAGNLEVPASVKVQFEMNLMELNTGYEIFDVRGPFSSGPHDERNTRGELYVGARYYAVKPTIEAQVGPAYTKIGDWTSWVDGLVGARLFVDLSKTVVLGIQGDVGGFNIGNSDNLAFSQITSLSWNFSDSMAIHLGYKFLNFRKENGANTLTTELRGPFVATSVRF